METIVYPLIGGILIGFSSSTMLGGLGRITGISGIVGAILGTLKKEHYWRYSFLAGLLVGGVVLKIFFPHLFQYSLDFKWWQIVLAGLLVGIGTRLGSGCTSGHGVCGLARLSRRSLVAVITFMGFGMITVALKGLVA